MEKRTFVLRNETIRQRAADHIFTVPDGYRVIVQEDTRTLSQSYKFHAICTELEKLKVLWFNKPRTKDQWKILLVSGHAVHEGKPVELVPGLEGEMVNLRESTASMGKSRGSSLIEYSQAYLEMNRP